MHLPHWTPPPPQKEKKKKTALNSPYSPLDVPKGEAANNYLSYIGMGKIYALPLHTGEQNYQEKLTADG